MLTIDTCLARSYWTRCTRDAKPGPQARFKENLELFFEAVYQQARDRDTKLIPDLDSYISVSVCEAPVSAREHACLSRAIVRCFFLLALSRTGPEGHERVQAGVRLD